MLTHKDRPIHQDFPIFAKQRQKHPHYTYLDSAATTHKPLCVVEAMMDFYLYENATVHRAVYELAAEATDRYLAVRDKVKNLIKAKSSDEIVFTSGTTEGINLIAYSFSRAFLKEGDEILISQVEHHANIVPWQIVAKERKLKLKVIPVSDQGELDIEAFKSLLTPKTKLVSLAYTTNTTGVIYPIKEITALAHEAGAKVLVDAAQAISHQVIDVQQIDCDFLVFSAHKMYGPTGVGVLYGKKELLQQMPPYHSGGDMIEKVSMKESIFKRPPLRFEAGTPKIAEVIGMGVAIDYLMDIGLEKIEAYEKKLTEYALKRIKEIPGVKILGGSQNRGSLITFIIPGVHSLDIGTLLNLKGISVRTGQLCAEVSLERFNISSALRISFGIYNSFEDIDYFLEMLQETLLLLRVEFSY